MAGKIDQMEAEAEAAGEIQEEYTGDTLASQFTNLEKTAGADEDLAALKRKMGLAPPEPTPPPAEVVPTRVEAPAEAPAKGASHADQEELAAALEELEAEHQAEQRKMGR
jgi:phage shock protein A